MWWYYVVGLIWISEFILACQQMVISGAVATWYFSRYVTFVPQSLGARGVVGKVGEILACQ